MEARHDIAPRVPQLAAEQHGHTGPRRWLSQKYLSSIYPLLALAVLVIWFWIRSPYFATSSDLDNILRQASFLLVLALAGTVVILIGGIDLSVGANATLGGYLVAKYVDSTGLLPAILIALAVGGAAGLINGLVNTRLRVPSFLVTLGMASVLDGISNTVGQGQPLNFASSSLPDLVNKTPLFGIPNVALIAGGTALILTVVGFRTRFGRYLYAIGGGERPARLSGIDVAQYKVYAFVLAGVLAGLGGVLLTGQADAATPLAGDPFLLNSIAAVVVGGTALSGGVGGAHRTVLGVLVLTVLSTGMDITNVHPYTQEIVEGVVVIGAVALTIDRRKYAFIK
jgi:ribose transport system permease protein